jgi:hypothetical protein
LVIQVKVFLDAPVAEFVKSYCSSTVEIDFTENSPRIIDWSNPFFNFFFGRDEFLEIKASITTVVNYFEGLEIFVSLSKRNQKDPPFNLLNIFVLQFDSFFLAFFLSSGWIVVLGKIKSLGNHFMSLFIFHNGWMVVKEIKHTRQCFSQTE